MGALFGWILRGLQIGGPVALGYWWNDLATWWSGVLSKVGIGPDKQTTTTSSGGTRWAIWFVLVLAIVAGLAIYIVMKLIAGLAGKSGKKMFALLWCAVAFTSIDLYFGLGDGLCFAELLGSIAAATTNTIKSNYCPEYIVFNRATVPTQFDIKVAGDGVIFSLDGTGLTNLNGIRCVGELPANQYVFQIADGYVRKNTSLTIANPAGAQLDVYGFSDSEASYYQLHLMAQSFANQSLKVDDFYYAAFPSAAATDTFTITFADGTTEDMLRNELECYLAYTQEVTATRYNVDNYRQTIKKIQFKGAADQSIYYLRRNPVRGGTVDQTLSRV